MPQLENHSIMHTQAVLLGTNTTNPKLTLQDCNAVAGRGPKSTRSTLTSRVGVIVDQRTKDITERLTKKHHNRSIDRIVARIDVQMQKLLETQDPAEEELYDKFAERRAMYLSKKL